MTTEAPALVRAASLDAMVEAFASLFDGRLREFSDVGPVVHRAFSPGDLDTSPVDDERGSLSDSELRALGWPLQTPPPDDGDQDVADSEPFRLLPWIGAVSAHEIESMLTPDAIAAAPTLLLEPQAAAHLFMSRYNAQYWLSPEQWACLWITVRSPAGYDRSTPRDVGELFLALRRLEDSEDIAVFVLPVDSANRLATRALLGIEQADIDAAQAGDVEGELAGI